MAGRDDELGRRVVLLVLGVLREAPLHGYAIARRIERASDEVFSLGEGVLYPLLHQMEQAGLVCGNWEAADGRRRKVYGLTDAGRRRFVQEQRLWEREAAAVRRVLAMREGVALAMG